MCGGKDNVKKELLCGCCETCKCTIKYACPLLVPYSVIVDEDSFVYDGFFSFGTKGQGGVNDSQKINAASRKAQETIKRKMPIQCYNWLCGEYRKWKEGKTDCLSSCAAALYLLIAPVILEYAKYEFEKVMQYKKASVEDFQKGGVQKKLQSMLNRAEAACENAGIDDFLRDTRVCDVDPNSNSTARCYPCYVIEEAAHCDPCDPCEGSCDNEQDDFDLPFAFT